MRRLIAALFFFASPLVAGTATHFQITAPAKACAIDVDTPVEIDAAPADAHAMPGDTATFTVTAFGSNIHYAWFHGTSGDARTPVGTDSPSFTTWAVTKPLSFWVRVWNGCGAVDTAAVTATPVPLRRRAAGAP